MIALLLPARKTMQEIVLEIANFRLSSRLTWKHKKYLRNNHVYRSARCLFQPLFIANCPFVLQHLIKIELGRISNGNAFDLCQNDSNSPGPLSHENVNTRTIGSATRRSAMMEATRYPSREGFPRRLFESTKMWVNGSRQANLFSKEMKCFCFIWAQTKILKCCPFQSSTTVLAKQNDPIVREIISFWRWYTRPKKEFGQRGYDSGVTKHPLLALFMHSKLLALRVRGCQIFLLFSVFIFANSR